MNYTTLKTGMTRCDLFKVKKMIKGMDDLPLGKMFQMYNEDIEKRSITKERFGSHFKKLGLNKLKCLC